MCIVSIETETANCWIKRYSSHNAPSDRRCVDTLCIFSVSANQREHVGTARCQRICTEIRFKKKRKRFSEISSKGVSKTKFDVLIANGDKIKDPTGILIDISKYKWGNMKHRVVVESDTDVNVVFYLLKQSYEITKRSE